MLVSLPSLPPHLPSSQPSRGTGCRVPPASTPSRAAASITGKCPVGHGGCMLNAEARDATVSARLSSVYFSGVRSSWHVCGWRQGSPAAPSGSATARSARPTQPHGRRPRAMDVRATQPLTGEQRVPGTTSSLSADEGATVASQLLPVQRKAGPVTNMYRAPARPDPSSNSPPLPGVPHAASRPLSPRELGQGDSTCLFAHVFPWIPTLVPTLGRHSLVRMNGVQPPAVRTGAFLGCYGLRLPQPLPRPLGPLSCGPAFRSLRAPLSNPERTAPASGRTGHLLFLKHILCFLTLLFFVNYVIFLSGLICPGSIKSFNKSYLVT